MAVQWNQRKLLALGAAILAAAIAVVAWWWSAARRAPLCNSLPWWPKKALGKKAVKAGLTVLDLYKTFPGTISGAFYVASFDYWTAATGESYRVWIFTQMVSEYLYAGGIELPEDLPPCVFAVDGDCGPCKELRAMRDALDAAILENPDVGVPKI